MIWRNLLEVARILKIHAGSSPFDWAELLESMLDRSQNRLAWSLLRLSAELKGEMAEILYGTNTLEFCGPGGWKKLHAFLLQIGPTNQAYLRELVLPIPVEGFLICWGWVFGEADPS